MNFNKFFQELTNSKMVLFPNSKLYNENIDMFKEKIIEIK